MIERRLRKYILPNVLGTLGVSLYLLADSLFISVAAGTRGIAALNLSLPLYAIIHAIGAIIAIGCASRFTILRSMGEKESEAYFSTSILWSILFAAVFVVFGIFRPETVIRLLGANDEIMEIGLPYLKVVLLCAPFFMLYQILSAFIRNDGAPRIAMAATLTSNIFNVVLDYILMFPCGMGMQGAAVATGLSPLVGMGVCMVHYLSKNNTIRFLPVFPSVKRLVSGCVLGVAAFVGEISSGVIAFVFNMILLGLGGNVAVAAYGVVANVSLVGISMFNGVSQGLQPMASEAEGSGDKEAKHRIYVHSLQIGLILAVVVAAICWIFTTGIVGAFNSEHSDQMAVYAVKGLRLYSIGFLPAIVNIVRSGFYGATNRPKECSIISVSRGIIVISLCAIVMSRMFGIVGVWLAFPVSELVTYLISLIYSALKNRAVK